MHEAAEVWKCRLIPWVQGSACRAAFPQSSFQGGLASGGPDHPLSSQTSGTRFHHVGKWIMSAATNEWLIVRCVPSNLLSSTKEFKGLCTPPCPGTSPLTGDKTCKHRPSEVRLRRAVCYRGYVWPEDLGNRGGPVLACQSLAMQKRDGSGCQPKGNMGDGTQEPKNSET